MNKTYAFEADEHAGRAFDSAERATFVTKTYSHLFVAILGLVGIEFVLFQTNLVEPILRLASTSWLLFLGAIMLTSWVASRVASSAQSLPLQYCALAGYVVVQSIVLCPLLYIASVQYEGILTQATGITLLGFAALTAVAFVTRKDFSFLRGVLIWGGVCAFGLIVAAMFFGFTLGPIFSVAMIAFAGAAILYDTSNVIHHYPEDRYVGAALQLFASVVMLFWYVLRLLMSLRGD